MLPIPELPNPLALAAIREIQLTYGRLEQVAEHFAESHRMAMEAFRAVPAYTELFAAEQVAAQQVALAADAFTRDFQAQISAITTFAFPHQALYERVEQWVREISVGLARIEPASVFHAFEVADASGLQWRDAFEVALGDVELQAADGSVAMAGPVPDEFVGALKQAAKRPNGRGLGAVIAGFVGRILDTDATTRAFYFVALFQLFYNILPSVVEVEYDRWRNAPEGQAQSEEARRQTEALERILAELRQVQERLANPPVQAVVRTDAVLRDAPDSASGRIIVRLKAGTSILVTERRNGWLHVVAEPVPGEVHEGWVFGRFTKYGSR